MTSYRIIRDACEATGGGGLFCQLQRHHMTEEVYDLLKRLNVNNSGMNASGIESGNTEEIPTNPNENSPPAVVYETGVDFGALGENVQNIINQTPQRPKTIPFGRRDSMSQSSTMSFALGRKEYNLANHMNQNMQNMLSPLLVLIQHGQKRAEERDRIQRDREIELRSQEAEREERRREREAEAKIRAKEKAHSERLNLVMLTVLAKIGGINKEDLQLDW
ncbi:hypothetical protein O181_126368 [Austropuccinia psidii MF-1]|uniref:Uncharacterized protein n=1 Tax=Austropuccinia psidii MF-1 TaxID=1389203 RepID=A0A9Q3Q5X7_9BASI|nr:hypothetical protein [Austropuccinia psidii MF-1]